ncbi:DUF3602 domain-containing protein, partial [Cellulosimicrobium funkei]|uniref:DUF3602 domain-containing protein n=1 Tax=Cellulosimicrobium funkei TaxID=264251 RepID=UPI003F8F1EE1
MVTRGFPGEQTAPATSFRLIAHLPLEPTPTDPYQQKKQTARRDVLRDMTAPEVSHGRGGAGNIAADDTQYVDGEVVRVGVEGSHGDGAFSTGRGGET